jgi:hypothetical protein
MFELMHEVVTELVPTVQIIVCDHANLPDQRFQDAVRHNWRDGEALLRSTNTTLSLDLAERRDSHPTADVSG